jgi:glycine oxidase
MVDCLIIGGGVIGLALAWRLAVRGRTVRVLERLAERGREACWAGAGILPPASRDKLAHPLDQLRGWSFELHRQWAETLRAETGVDTGYRRCGGVYLARSIGEAAALTGWGNALESEGICAKLLSKPLSVSLNQVEPGLTASDRGDNRVIAAWHLPDECQVRNPRYLQALRQVCEQRGVVIEPLSEVIGFQFDNDKIGGVITGQGVIKAGQVCIASGAWSGTLLQKLGITLGVIPIRGQIVLFKSDRPVLRTIVNEGPRYLVPRDDGRLLAGSTEEEAGFDKRTTEEGISDLVAFARSLVPALASAQIERTWAGLRPASFDGFPYLGTIPGYDNAFVATGHFRSGLYLSPATAMVMAELMCGERPSVDLGPFAVGR